MYCIQHLFNVNLNQNKLYQGGPISFQSDLNENKKQVLLRRSNILSFQSKTSSIKAKMWKRGFKYYNLFVISWNIHYNSNINIISSKKKKMKKINIKILIWISNEQKNFIYNYFLDLETQVVGFSFSNSVTQYIYRNNRESSITPL